ncbi:MAG: protein kinase, partial [Candidatus Zixiibacteriota bacterium]
MTEDNPQENQTQSFAPLAKGTQVARYRIIERVGVGGMGEVYLADDTELERRVALKFLPLQFLSDEELKARFKREAQAAAALDHPNIVTVYEVGDYQGRPFIAMQYVEGQSLSKIIKDKSLPLHKVIDLAIQICEGLKAAHEASIIHRDVKPSNICISAAGRPKLVDFGLASVRGSEKITRTGSTLGTVGYMSPEQIRGHETDHRSDLFSFGVVLYEMVTGRLPFTGDTEAAVIGSILKDSPEPLRRFKADLPDSLQQVINKALDKDSDTRYQTAAGMLADLKRIVKEFAAAETVPTPEKPIKRSYRGFLIPAAIVVVAVLVLILKPWKFEVGPSLEAVAAENRLAIMYFDNLADPADSLRYGEIVTNLLITDLSESQFLQVVSSQRLYDILKLLGREGEKKINREIASQVAQKAEAKWMLMGSILQMEPHIMLTAQLVEVASGNAVATQRVSGEPGEMIFPLVDRLTVAIK